MTNRRYWWGVPEDDTYLNWPLLKWRLGNVLFFAWMFSYVPVMLWNWRVAALWALVVLATFFQPPVTTVLEWFDTGRGREEDRLRAERPRPVPDLIMGYARPQEKFRQERARYEREMILFKPKRRAWRKERRRRWLHGNFRQFPMGPLFQPAFLPRKPEPVRTPRTTEEMELSVKRLRRALAGRHGREA